MVHGRTYKALVEPVCIYSGKQRTKRKRPLSCQGVASSAHSSQDPDKEDSRTSSKTPANEDDRPENLDPDDLNTAEPQSVDWREFRYCSTRMLYICGTNEAVVLPYACQLSCEASIHVVFRPMQAAALPSAAAGQAAHLLLHLLCLEHIRRAYRRDIAFWHVLTNTSNAGLALLPMIGDNKLRPAPARVQAKGDGLMT